MAVAGNRKSANKRKEKIKKLLTIAKRHDKLPKLLADKEQVAKKAKKFLTDMERCGNLIWLSQRTEKQLIKKLKKVLDKHKTI